MYYYDVSDYYSRRGNKVMTSIQVSGCNIEKKVILNIVANYTDHKLIVLDVKNNHPHWKLPEGFVIDNNLIENHLNESIILRKVHKSIKK